MAYSKLRQERMFQETIKYKTTKCPICQKKGEYNKNIETGDIECQCGYIIHTMHQYVAGQKINTELIFKTIRRHKNGNK